MHAPTWAPSKIEGLGRSDTRDQTIRDIGRGSHCWRVLRTIKNEVAMDIIGN